MTAVSARQRVVRRVGFASIGVLALLLVGCDVEFSASMGDTGGTFDAAQLGGEIAADLTAQLGGAFEVACPEDQPVEPGSTFECEAVDENGQVGVIGVTVVDEDGNVDWELLEVRNGDASGDASGDAEDATGEVFDGAHLGGVIAADLSAQLGGAFDVSCPEDQPMRPGATFECEATDGAGQIGLIAVTAVDDTGNVDWELVDAIGAAGAPGAAEAALAPEDVQRPDHVPADWTLFLEPGAGFSLWHPADWTPEGTGSDWIFDVPSGHDTFGASLGISIVPTVAGGGGFTDKFDFAEVLVDLFDDTEHELLSDGIEVDRIAWQADNTEVALFGILYTLEGAEFGQLTIIGDRDEQTLARLSFSGPALEFGDLLEEVVVDVMESFDTAPLG